MQNATMAPASNRAPVPRPSTLASSRWMHLPLTSHARD
jgi:hypothetical protein